MIVRMPQSLREHPVEALLAAGLLLALLAATGEPRSENVVQNQIVPACAVVNCAADQPAG